MDDVSIICLSTQGQFSTQRGKPLAAQSIVRAICIGKVNRHACHCLPDPHRCQLGARQTPEVLAVQHKLSLLLLCLAKYNPQLRRTPILFSLAAFQYLRTLLQFVLKNHLNWCFGSQHCYSYSRFYVFSNCEEKCIFSLEA